ncbi:NAD(P)H-dependent oxidoreductase [Acidimangrovimonas sediminis]|uniref:NAD(P)H-dependent oxidoreductase n=1 Tax=Acidimangrovimonas sediminis TaxID=2056283 RepID=UPI000C7F8DC8|nr:NAD(P)H-dependent oxidoreductase [Acidimangrovimonas sediminis]
MRVLIVLAHPERTSFNGALTRAAVEALEAAGHEAEVSDLYAEGFGAAAGRGDFAAAADPLRFHYQAEQGHAAETGGFAPEIAREQARVRAADLLVLQFPLWWGAPPALLKGWFERVMAYGFAYVDGRRFDTGLFRGRRALMSVTTGGTPGRFSDGDVYGPIESVLYPVRRLALEYMGYEVDDPFVAYAAPRIGAEERAACIAAWQARIVAAADAARRIEIADPLAALAEVGAGAWSRA